MNEFHTVKEAARLTGKSSSSIRRIIYPIIENDQHRDREHVQPTVEQVRVLRLKGENFAWRISDELLRREIPADSVTDKRSEKPAGQRSHDANAELLAMLQAELDIKNRQIAQQMELISGLSERLREGNILIGSLQKRLPSPEAGARPFAEAVDAEPAQQTMREQGSETNGQATKPKPGFFSRFFS